MVDYAGTAALSEWERNRRIALGLDPGPEPEPEPVEEEEPAPEIEKPTAAVDSNGYTPPDEFSDMFEEDTPYDSTAAFMRTMNGGEAPEIVEPNDGRVNKAEDLASRFVRGLSNIPASVGESAAIAGVSSTQAAARIRDVGGASGLNTAGYSTETEQMASDDIVARMTQNEREAVLKSSSEQDITSITGDPRWTWAQNLRKSTEDLFPTNPEFNEDLTSQIAEVGGEAVGFVMAGLVSPAVTAALGASSNASSQFKDAIMSEDATLDDALNAATIGGFLGVTEAAPITLLFNRLDKYTGGFFKDALAATLKEKFAKGAYETVKGAFEEAIQETLTAVGNNFTANTLVGWDQDRELIEGVGEQAGMGAGFGAVFSAAMTAAGMKISTSRQRAFEKSFENNVIAGLDEEQALRSLDPENAQLYVPATDFRGTPPDQLDSDAEIGPVKINTEAQLPSGESYIGQRPITGEAPNQEKYYDTELQQLGDLARDIITGKLVGPEREAAIARMDQYKEQKLQELNNIVDATDRFPSKPEPLYQSNLDTMMSRLSPGQFAVTEPVDVVDGENQLLREHGPTKVFDINSLQEMEQPELDALGYAWEAFAEERGIDPNKGAIPRLLYEGEDYLSSPRKEDVEFLKDRGYTAAAWGRDGENKFLFDEGARDTSPPEMGPRYRLPERATKDGNRVFYTEALAETDNSLEITWSGRGNSKTTGHYRIYDDGRVANIGAEKAYADQRSKRPDSKFKDAIERRSLDWVNGELRLPNQMPATEYRAKAMIKATEARLERNQRYLDALEELPDDASVQEVRSKLWGDAHVTTKQQAIREIENTMADSQQFIDDLKLLKGRTMADAEGGRVSNAPLPKYLIEDAVSYLNRKQAKKEFDKKDERRKSMESKLKPQGPRVVELPDRDATDLGPAPTEEELFDEASIDATVLEDLAEQFPDKRSTLTKAPPRTGQSSLGLRNEVLVTVAADMESAKVGAVQERKVGDKIVIVKRTPDGFTWSVKGEVQTSKDGGNYGTEVFETTEPKAEGELAQDQVLPPPKPPRGPPPKDPNSIGGISERDVTNPTNQMRTLALVSKHHGKIEIDLDSGVEVLQTMSSDGTKSVARIRLADGSFKSLTEEDVQQMVLTDQYSLRDASLRTWRDAVAAMRGKTRSVMDRKLDSNMSKTKKLLTTRLRDILQEAHGFQRKIKSTTDQIQGAWRARHGEDVQNAKADHRDIMYAYMTGKATRAEVINRTDMDADFVKLLDSVMRDKDALSRAMISGNMVDGPLQLQIEENLGVYFRVQYALKDLNARKLSASALMRQIPESRRNAVSDALRKAYIDPLFDEETDLANLDKGTLRRMANLYGLTRSRRPPLRERWIVDPETGKRTPAADQVVIANTDISLRTATKKQLIEVLRTKIDESTVLPEDIMLSFLQGGATRGSGASQHGREKSIERARKLSRTDAQFKEAGYSDAEIAFNRAIQGMLAEHTDPITITQETVNAMFNHIASHKMVQAVYDMHIVGAANIGTPRSETGADTQLVGSNDQWADVLVVTDKATGETTQASELYVRPEIKDAFDRMVKPNFVSNAFMDAYRVFQTGTKINLTALNLSSHPRNMRSAAEIVMWRGYALGEPERVTNAIKIALRLAARDSSFGQKATAKPDEDASVAYLVSLGIFHDGIRTGAMTDMLQRMASSEDTINAFGKDTFIRMDGSPVEEAVMKAIPFRQKLKNMADSKLAPTTLENLHKAMWSGPLSMYRLEDEGFKVVVFMQEREILANMLGRDDLVEVMSGKKDPTPKQAEEIRKLDKQAAQKVRRLLPTYSMVPERLKDFSANFLAVPFPSFNAEMMRNTWHDLGDMIGMAKHVAMGNKATGEYAEYYKDADQAKVAARLASRAVSWGAMSAYTGARVASLSTMFAIGAMGYQPEEDDEITKTAYALRKAIELGGGKVPDGYNYDAFNPFMRAMIPGWGQESLYQMVSFVPGKEFTVVSGDYTLPHGQMITAGINAAGVANALMAGNTREAQRAARQLLFQFAGDYMQMEPLAKALLEVYNGEDQFGREIGNKRDWMEDKGQKLLHVMTVAAPYSQVYKTADRLLSQDPNDPHRQTIGMLLSGNRPLTVQMDTGYVKAMWPMSLELKDRTEAVKDLIRDAAATGMSEEDFKEEYELLESERAMAAERIRKLNLYADVMGFGDRERRKAIQGSTLLGSDRMTTKQMHKIDLDFKPLRLGIDNIYKSKQKHDPATSRLYRQYRGYMHDVQKEQDWR